MGKRVFFVFLSLIFLSYGLWALEKPIIVGKERGEGELIQPRHGDEGPDGNIYILDWYDGYIKVYSPEGKFIRKMGGKGEGPGEIKRVDGANFGFTHDGKIFITEFFGGHPWISVLDLNGKFQKAIHLSFKGYMTFGVLGARSLPDGTFLVHVNFFEKPKRVEDYFQYIMPDVLFRINENGEVLSQVLRKDYVQTISFAEMRGDIGSLPFVPMFLWIPYKEKGIIFADGLSRTFTIYDFSGNKIGQLSTPLPEPEKVTSKDLEEWRESRKEVLKRDVAWFERFGKVIDKYKKSIYEKKPNLAGISLTPQDNILIAGADGTYYLINSKGKLLTSIKPNVSRLKITKSFVLFAKEDEEGSITVYSLKRKGSEAEDLKRVQGL